MAYKTNYELWNPALTSRRPSQMSDIDIILSQTYPHVAMLPYMQCLHCNPIELEESYSPATMSTFANSEDGSDDLTSATADKCKRRKIRQRLRQLLKRAPRSHN